MGSLTKSFISEISLSTSCMLEGVSIVAEGQAVWVVDHIQFYDEVDQFVPKHLVRVEVGNEEADIVALHRNVSFLARSLEEEQVLPTLIAFLLRMKNDSALCVKKRVNLWTRMCSISSACLILMLILTELTLGSMSTLSFSLRAMVSGVSSTSGEV